MNKYENYKKVEIPWVRKIPTHWRIERNKNIFIKIKSVVGIQNKTTDLLSLTTKGIKVKSKDQIGGKQPSSYEGYQFVNKGNLVLCLFDLDCSAVFSDVSQYNGMISPAYDVFKVEKQIPQYYKYLFSYLFQDRVYKIYSKSVRYTINVENFNALLTLVPPIEEQEHIAKYLDWKIGEIDKLIQIEKNKIEELEMYKLKEFNNIYKNLVNYKKIPLKRVSKVYSGKEIEDETKEGIPVYGSGKNIFKYTTKELLNGEYIIFGRKGTIGKPYKLSGKFWIVDTAYAIKNNDLVLLDYLYYLLRIFNWEDFLTNTVKPSIVANQILQVKMRIPSIEIQEKIVKNIYSLEEKIENTIKLSNKKISLLIELKNALISEVVTGQIDVRNVKIPERK